MARLSLARTAALACAAAAVGIPWTAAAAARERAVSARNGCPGADLAPTRADLARVGAATLCLVNRERARHDERPLRANALLAHAAQGHSASMARYGYFNHVGPHGQTPLSRVRAAGYLRGDRGWFRLGENIAWGTLWLATPRAIVATWMASPPHRANILDPHYRDTAIGVAPGLAYALSHGQPGAMYTEDFAARG